MSDDSPQNLDDAVSTVWSGEEEVVVVDDGEYSFTELGDAAIRVQHLSAEEAFVGQEDLVGESGVIVEVMDADERSVEERKAFDSHKLDSMKEWIDVQLN